MNISTGLFSKTADIPPTFALTYGANHTLYGTTGATILTINPSTGAYTSSGSSGTYTVLGLAGSGIGSTLLGINGFGQLMVDNIVTGSTTPFGPGLYPPGQPTTGALTYGPGASLYSMIYAESANGGDDRSRLFTRDPATGAAALVGTYDYSYWYDAMVYADGHLYGFARSWLYGAGDTITDFTTGSAVSTGVVPDFGTPNTYIVAAAWDPASDVTATPEPTSIAILAAATGVGAFTLRRSKRKLAR